MKVNQSRKKTEIQAAMANEGLLNAAGFTWHPTRTIWISTDGRKAFAREVVEDRDEAWLRSRLYALVPNGQFWFFFSAPPHDLSVCREILHECGLSSLTSILQS